MNRVLGTFSHLPTSTTESKCMVSRKAKVVRGLPQVRLLINERVDSCVHDSSKRWHLGILMLQYGTGKLEITRTTYPDSLPYMVAVTILLVYKLQVKKRSTRRKEGKIPR